MNLVTITKPDNSEEMMRGPGFVKLVGATKEGTSMAVLLSGHVPNIELAIGDCYRMLRKDVIYERQRFEDYITKIMDEVVARGVPLEGYEPGQNMLWRREDGRYGVHALNSVWQGWMAAMNIPTGVIPKKG